MAKYKVLRKTGKNILKDGSVSTWESKNYYLRYYRSRKLIYEDLGTSDFTKASKTAEERMNSFTTDTLLLFLERYRWFSATENPMYLDAKNGVSRYSYQYGQAKRNAMYLEVVFKQLKDPLGDCIYNQITKGDVSDFKERLSHYLTYIDGYGNERKITPTFRNRALDSLSTIYSYYLRKSSPDIPNNPFLGVDRFKTPKKKNKLVITPELIECIFDKDALRNHSPSTWIRKNKDESYPLSKKRWLEILDSVYFDYFKFIAFTGLRISEASALTVGQFEKKYENRVVIIDRAFKSEVSKTIALYKSDSIEVVGNTKTGVSRIIVLCDEAYQTVMPYLEGKQDSDFVFTTSRSNHSVINSLVSKKQEFIFRIFINELADFYEIELDNNQTISLHGFRTSLNTNLLSMKKNNLRESIIASYLGWSSKSLTRVQDQNYTEYGISQAAQVADAINRMYFPYTKMEWNPKNEEKKSLSYKNKRDWLKNHNTVSPENRFRELILRLDLILGSGTYNRRFESKAELKQCSEKITSLLKRPAESLTKPLFENLVSNETANKLIKMDEEAMRIAVHLNETWHVSPELLPDPTEYFKQNK